MSRTHVLAPAAAADLREIARYTQDQWGDAQARRYAAQIDEGCAALAAGKPPCKDLGHLLPGLRSKLVGSHFVFGLVRESRPTLILAVLHERMDLMQRLSQRLRY